MNLEDLNIFENVHGRTKGLLQIIKCDYLANANELILKEEGQFSDLRKIEISKLDGEIYFQFFPENNEKEPLETKRKF